MSHNYEQLVNNHIQNIFGCSSANFDKYPDMDEKY